MTYRHMALTFASIVAMTVACDSDTGYKSAPNFAQQVEAGSQESNTDTADHGAVSADGTVKPAEKVSAPVVASKPATPPPPAAPATPSQEDKFKAMLAAGKVMNTVVIEPGKTVAWGTTAAARLEVLVAVDAAGAPLSPAGIADRQIESGTVAAPVDTKFQANGADVAAVHSSLRVCNNSGGPIYLHSGNNAPFAHGDGAIATGTCSQFLAQRAVATDGASYDHTAGNAPANYVFLKVTKIGPDGKIVP